ncbi:MAG: chromosome segregation protein SMC [Clostridiales bacterium]|nr:chromosome segregation protein SMC [Candidatus Crickella equi]
MYFKRIEMQGFKSFADPVTIELNDGVTCIIGPNGSGKSNISDALRWVLGEQSSKQLRGNKMQDVIFAGTATRKPKGMAEVTLVIDNTTGILPLEYNEVAVTRRMYRSGESEYMINGNQCRLRDIKELFMDTGIGVDGYSIIGQGKIAEIVSSKGEDRRQIFEEAAGVVLYKSRKTEAENKLKTATENLDRVKDIINEIEGRIGGLKEDSEKATEFIGLRDRYKKLGINIILHNLESLDKSVKQGAIDLEELENKLTEATSKSQEFENTLEQFRLQDAELNAEFNQANEDLLAKVEELNIITSGGQLNAERLANIEKNLIRLNDAINDAEEKLESEKAQFAELEQNDSDLNSAMNSVKNEYEQAVIAFNEHTFESNKINSDIEQSKERIIELNNTNVRLNAEIQTLENYKKTLADRKESLNDDYNGKDEKDAENKARLAEIEIQLAAKGDELETSRKSVYEFSDKILAAGKKIEEINVELDELTAQTNRAIARKNTIEEMEHNYEGYNSAVRMLMQKSMGGILGTVSDLITVPNGYEVAIETALGNNLQNIVCKDDASAKSAINWLKSARAGRATFLPVESVHADRLPLGNDVKNANGFIGIASEMVTADSKFDEIVDYLLCRVIIAKTMDDAIKMSKMNVGGFRIVTIDGEVINSYGAITGGKFANKTANLLDRKKEIGELSAKIDDFNSKADELKNSRESARSEEKKLTDERVALNEKIQKLEIEYNVLKTDRDHASDLVDTDSDANAKYESEIKTIAEDIERADAMIAKYRTQIDEADSEAKQLESDVESMIDKSDEFKAVIEEDNEKIVSLKVKMGEQDTKVLAQNEMIERIRDTITELESGLEDDKNSRADLEHQRNLLTNNSAESGEKEETLRAEKKSLEDKIEDLTSKMDKNRLDNEETIRAQKSNTEQLEQIRDDKYKLEIKNARNETMLDTQKDKLWEEFEVSYAEALDMKDDDFAVTAGNKESREIKLRMAELGDVNIGAIEEYKAVSKRYEFMTAQEADITKAMKELNEIITNMDKTIRVKFKENFDQVVINFEKSFKELFGGGYAELRLEDENNPLESGIEITAQPPGKKLKNINLLSGGEKTLTAIALMFAVLKAKPTPFVILDEVEAALDEVNIERFSGYLRDFDNIQFALITHQKATMEHADVLYGVTMPEQGISKMLSLKLGDEFDID